VPAVLVALGELGEQVVAPVEQVAAALVREELRFH